MPEVDPGELLPHEPPFLFVDKVLRHDETSIATARRVPLGEPWTNAHFPGEPIVPGVLILEGMAQTCGLLLRLTLQGKASEGSALAPRGYLAEVSRARFYVAVEPGATIIHTARLVLKVGMVSKYSVISVVADTKVAEAEIVIAVAAT